MTLLGTKIRKLRELKNLKQEYVANALGISQRNYCKIENNEAALTHERLEDIANVLEISVKDILSFDESKVFNVMYNQNATGEIHIQHYHESPKEVNKLYEEKIRLLEEMNDYLKKEIERLKSSR